MSKKTYLDYFLDNEYHKEEQEKKKRKKKEWRFDQTHEDAILLFNSGTLKGEESEVLWKEVIYPSLLVIVKGVMEMPKFHNLPHNLDRLQLIDDTLLRLVEKIDRFTPGLVGKSGLPVKAFSYFSTIAKNFILEKCLKANKIIDNKADVETSIDLTILSEETLQNIFSKCDVIGEDTVVRFETEILHIVRGVELILFEHNNQFSDFYKIGKTLVYILTNWHKIDFEKKNDFMRILVLYTGLKQQNVSTIFKKYKNLLIEKGFINIYSGIFSGKETKRFKNTKNEDEEIESDEDVEESTESSLKKKKYTTMTLEDYEALEQIEENNKYKKHRYPINENIEEEFIDEGEGLDF